MKPSASRAHAGRIRRLKALIIKESLQVVRDPSCILIAFVLPLIFLFLFGYGVSLDAQNIRIGIALEDSSPEAHNLASSFIASRFFDTRIARNRRELEPDLVSGRLRGVVVIPQNFTRLLKAKESIAPIQLLTDGSECNTANYVENYARGALASWLSQQGLTSAASTNPPVELISRVFYNPSLNSRNSLVPGSLAVIMAIIGTLLTALIVAREWERGTMEALLATPLTAGEIIIGKLVPYFCLGMGSMAVCTAIAVFLLDVPLRGSFAALAIVSAAFMLTALGQGFLISTLSRNQFIASQISIISAFLPAFILSGFVFEIASMPWLLRQLTRIIPARYFVTSLQTLFLAGDIWPLLLPNTIILLVIAAVMFALTLKKTHNRLE
ncbi:MAG: ABC transporter permease [Desulfobacterales bacterium]|nr:ABC transporter permease [Desulfobacterales bacterium]MDD4073643.1 ABC transporter permease [Desulfobacterales bacterium]MDD4391848.1 ABC transporter permease [Desulfobacterales bacterium]